jgi:transposase
MQYSNDLRRKLLEAWAQWDGTQRELAQLFGVSRSYLQKVLRHWRQTGDLAAPAYRHGPVSRIEAARLARLVAARPDATLAELGTQLRVSPSAVCRRLQQLGLRLKKKDPARQRAR